MRAFDCDLHEILFYIRVFGVFHSVTSWWITTSHVTCMHNRLIYNKIPRTENKEHKDHNQAPKLNLGLKLVYLISFWTAGYESIQNR